MEKDDGETGSSVVVSDGDAVDLDLHSSLSALFVTLGMVMVKGPFAIALTGVYNSRHS
jgi:hypothetical protein